MASSPRASTVSQLQPTEQQAGEPTENEAFIPDEAQTLPSLKDEHGHPSISPKDHITRKPASPKDATFESIAKIVGGFVVGVALAISHHIFLTFLNGRNIDEYSQYWVKNANNAFSAFFSMCIAFAATCTLIQIKWNVARGKPLSIRSIDNLFALPSPVALFKTVTSTRLRSLRIFLLPIFAAIFIQSLAFVSVFAPNALTVARSAEISQDIPVMTLDLSTGPVVSVTGPSNTVYPSASSLWTTILTSIMLQAPLLNWKIPPGCGAACKFDLVYDGPGLQCMDTPSEPPPYGEIDGLFPLVYNTTSTLYPSLSREIKDQYEFRIGYISTDNHGLSTGRDGGSVHCVFRNATYKASFQVENNTMEAKHSIQSYGGILADFGDGVSNLWCSNYESESCLTKRVNTRAMCEVFASAFTGEISIDGVTGGINEAVLDLLFSHSSSMVLDFRLGVPNLSKGLVDLFSNLTLGFIPQRNDTTTVRAKVWDGSYAWTYTVWILWAVYLPTLLLASLVIINGLLSIQSNKRGMDDKFSNFLLTTRSTELDEMCIGATDFEEFQQWRLLYREEKGTFSVVSVPSEEVAEET